MLIYTKFGSVRNGRRPTAPSVTHQHVKYLLFLTVVHIDLELELIEGKHVPISGACPEGCRECVEFSTLNVDLEYVDERVLRTYQPAFV